MGDDTRITLRTATYWKDADGILHGEALEGAEQTLDDCKEQLKHQQHWVTAGPLPFLMDIRNARAVDREARAFYGGPEAARFFAATALIVGSPVSRALGNFFLGLNRVSMPTRLFTSESEATEWLKKFLPANR